MKANEFELIRKYFHQPAQIRSDVIFGIGDDAACLHVESAEDLLVSTDTLVAGVHFIEDWDPFDIAWKAVMVNLSDMAAMAATPTWITLALSLPKANEQWLERFSLGLHQALNLYHVSLVGGDTTQGPLSITITILGKTAKGDAVRRCGAHQGDSIMVSGYLGAAALAVAHLTNPSVHSVDEQYLMDKLLHPVPRLDLNEVLAQYASAAIDISDGLAADLAHLCASSNVGGIINAMDVPVDHIVKQYHPNALELALSGGDDYELCFTIPPLHKAAFTQALKKMNLICYEIGKIDNQQGLRIREKSGNVLTLEPKGYTHF